MSPADDVRASGNQPSVHCGIAAVVGVKALHGGSQEAAKASLFAVCNKPAALWDSIFIITYQASLASLNDKEFGVRLAPIGDGVGVVWSWKELN